MSIQLRRGAVVAAILFVSIALAACGGGEETATSAEKAVKPAQLGPSVETEAVAFVERPGTELDRVLTRFLGPVVKTKVEPGSAICRPGTATPSIDNATRYPFACIVRATADGEGLEVEITLGFVGTELNGSCWRAANERVLVTTTEPTLLGNNAKQPVNQIEGCA